MEKRLQLLLVLLIFVYAGDLATTYLLDPDMGLGQFPALFWGRLPYAALIAISMVALLAWGWKWSWEKSKRLLPKTKIEGPYFYWLLASQGCSERWAVVMARILPIVAIGMKAMLMVSNLIGYYLLNIADRDQNAALMKALGIGGSVGAFQQMIFGVLLAMIVAVGFGIFAWELLIIARLNKWGTLLRVPEATAKGAAAKKK